MDMLKIGKAIADARKSKKLTQEELAVKINVTPQAVSKWENGHNLPDIENLLMIADVTNTPYTVLLGVGDNGEETINFKFRNKYFNEDNMFLRMRAFAEAEGLTETYLALNYMRKQHAGQLRKKTKFSTEDVAYINHPLLMACQAHAMGIREDALLAAILLHDVVEDTGVTVEEIPFSDEVKKIVDLVSFVVLPGLTKAESKKEYYKRISENGKACVIKIIDRCNNVSTVAGSFTRERIIDYLEETENYILPLTDVLKNCYPEYSNVAFLIKYQLIGLMETIKYGLV